MSKKCQSIVDSSPRDAHDGQGTTRDEPLSQLQVHVPHRLVYPEMFALAVTGEPFRLLPEIFQREPNVHPLLLTTC